MGPSVIPAKAGIQGEGQAEDARSRFERTPFSDAGKAIPAERAGVTYRISEKERIKQRRAARLSSRRPESRRSGDVGGPGTLIYHSPTIARSPKDAAMIRKT